MAKKSKVAWVEPMRVASAGGVPYSDEFAAGRATSDQPAVRTSGSGMSSCLREDLHGSVKNTDSGSDSTGLERGSAIRTLGSSRVRSWK